MAKQAGFFRLTGCIGNVCFYKLYDQFYARMKSTLGGERVKKDPAFRKTMEYAGWMADAAKIGSAVYRSLPNEMKGRKIYQLLTGKALRMLREGIDKKDVLQKLCREENDGEDTNSSKLNNE